MDETITLLDKIIEEHKQITQKVRGAEQVLSDLEAGLKLGRAKEDFMPGRDDRRRHIRKLQQSLETIDKGLHAHFDREEKGLLTAFERRGDSMLVSALRVLLLEHQELKNRIAKSKKDASELAIEELSREVWEGRAWGMRTYINHTLKLLEVHAQSEQELLLMLRSKLGSTKGDD